MWEETKRNEVKQWKAERSGEQKWRDEGKNEKEE